MSQERRAVAVSRSNFCFQNGFSQKDKEDKLDNSEKFTEKSSQCLSLLTFELSKISIEGVRKIVICLLNVFMTKIFLNIITICIFIEQ